MSTPRVYCIDTSSILEARIRSYPPDIFPGLWMKVEMLIAERRLCSSEEVSREIGKKDDDTTKWAKSQHGLFVPLDLAQTNGVTQILKRFPLLVNNIKNRSGADPFVIALAKIHNYTVVTEETKSGSPMKPKIPDVCETYQIEYITFLDLVRLEKWIF